MPRTRRARKKAALLREIESILHAAEERQQVREVERQRQIGVDTEDLKPRPQGHQKLNIRQANQREVHGFLGPRRHSQTAAARGIKPSEICGSTTLRWGIHAPDPIAPKGMK